MDVKLSALIGLNLNGILSDGYLFLTAPTLASCHAPLEALLYNRGLISLCYAFLHVILMRSI